VRDPVRLSTSDLSAIIVWLRELELILKHHASDGCLPRRWNPRICLVVPLALLFLAGCAERREGFADAMLVAAGTEIAAAHSAAAPDPVQEQRLARAAAYIKSAQDALQPPDVGAVLTAAGSAAGQSATPWGGILGGMLGAAGTALGAVQTWRKRAADTATAQIVTAIEAAKQPDNVVPLTTVVMGPAGKAAVDAVQKTLEV
jgi:hypothetical protein